MNYFRILEIDLLFLKNKAGNNEIPLNPAFKIHGVTGLLCYRRFYISVRIALKNLKKFLMIHHHKIYFHELFRMSRSTRKLWERKWLIIDFFQYYLNRKLRALAPIQNS